MKFVGVTACPTGIAHSAMAAEALEEAAREKGHEIEVEIHGASGAEFVEPETIHDADAVIFALDASVAERGRFDGRPSVEVRLREAIDKPNEVIERAEAAARSGATAGAAARAPLRSWTTRTSSRPAVAADGVRRCGAG